MELPEFRSNRRPEGAAKLRYTLVREPAAQQPGDLLPDTSIKRVEQFTGLDIPMVECIPVEERVEQEYQVIRGTELLPAK